MACKVLHIYYLALFRKSVLIWSMSVESNMSKFKSGLGYLVACNKLGLTLEELHNLSETYDLYNRDTRYIPTLEGCYENSVR